MGEETVERPLAEQILDDMFANIEELEEFTPAVLQGLKQLAARGNLKRAPRIIRAIKAHKEGKGEIA